LTTYLETPRAGHTSPPAHPCCGSDVTRQFTNSEHFFHRSATVAAGSPWRFGSETSSKSGSGVPRPAASAASAGLSARELPSATLSARPVPRPPAQSSPSAPPLATVPGCDCISTVSVAPSPPTSTRGRGGAPAPAPDALGVRALPPGTRVPPLERLEPREGQRGPLERDREGDDATAV